MHRPDGMNAASAQKKGGPFRPAPFALWQCCYPLMKSIGFLYS